MERQRVTKLTSLAYHKIKNDIINNKIASGTILKSSEIADTLNMSRTPVREAISALAREGFVEVKNGVGAFVTETSESSIQELFEIRSVLELLALKMLMKSDFDRSVFENLEAQWHKLDEDVKKGDKTIFERINKLDRETHKEIINQSRSALLKELLEEDILLRMNRIQSISVYSLNNAKATIQQHLELLSLILANEYIKAKSMLKKHISDAVEYILAQNKNKN